MHAIILTAQRRVWSVPQMSSYTSGSVRFHHISEHERVFLWMGQMKLVLLIVTSEVHMFHPG